MLLNRRKPKEDSDLNSDLIAKNEAVTRRFQMLSASPEPPSPIPDTRNESMNSAAVQMISPKLLITVPASAETSMTSAKIATPSVAVVSNLKQEVDLIGRHLSTAEQSLEAEKKLSTSLRAELEATKRQLRKSNKLLSQIKVPHTNPRPEVEQPPTIPPWMEELKNITETNSGEDAVETVKSWKFQLQDTASLRVLRSELLALKNDTNKIKDESATNEEAVDFVVNLLSSRQRSQNGSCGSLVESFNKSSDESKTRALTSLSEALGIFKIEDLPTALARNNKRDFEANILWRSVINFFNLNPSLNVPQVVARLEAFKK